MYTNYCVTGNSQWERCDHPLILSLFSLLSLISFHSRVVSHGVHAGEILLLPHQVSSVSDPLFPVLTSPESESWENGGVQTWLPLVATWETTTPSLFTAILFLICIGGFFKYV